MNPTPPMNESRLPRGRLADVRNDAADGRASSIPLDN